MMRPIQLTTDRHRGVDLWKIAMIVVVLLALATRLYALGDRAVSHDETTHAKYSWNLYTGRGFRHDPLMHGPLLFEATAFFYALFGVSDFAARLYAALAGVALVASPWLLRRWLGRWGALLTSILLLISPSITYYSRYTRHDVPILLYTTLLLWSVLSYLDRDEGGQRWLLWMGAFFALMYATKENAYIYTAIFLGLWGLLLAWQVIRTPWQRPELAPWVLGLLILALVLGGGYVLASRNAAVIPEGEGNAAIGGILVPLWGTVALGGAALAGVGLVVAVVWGVGEARIRRLRLFDVVVVLSTFTLPLGSALLMDLIAGVDMTVFYPALMAANFSSVPLWSLMGAFVTLLITLGASTAVGLWWDRRQWPVIALVYYGIFIVLYSTLFTYGWGVLSGLIGGLAYWLSQQEVQRGSQPWYYYGLVGWLYDYLPLFVSCVGAAWLMLKAALGWGGRGGREGAPDAQAQPPTVSALLPRLFPWFLMAWAGLSWVAYIWAGEKMPWLFVHIAFPHILLTGWCLNRAIVGWGAGAREHLAHIRRGGWLVPVSLVCLALAWGALWQSSSALQAILRQSGAGQSLALSISQLQPLGRIIGGGIGLLLFGSLLYAAQHPRFANGPLGLKRTVWLTGATAVLVLAGLTVRTMVHLAFINDELATEYMVYAHATPDVNRVLDEIDVISWYLTGTPDQIQVAYGKDVAWPFYWYMDSRYPNNYYFDTPDAERLLDSPVIIAADSEWAAVEAITGSDYRSFDYKHIWWPVEDYKGLTWERIRAVLTEPARRSAIWDIIWDRDYRAYAALRNPEDPFTLTTWPHRMQFRFYVRQDLAERIWAYRLDGAQDLTEGAISPDGDGDPLAAMAAAVAPVARYAIPEAAAPRGIAVAPDGSIYVVDSEQHRILRLSSEGALITTWGGYGAAPGQFYEPWDVAVDADGDVYVADTWNHRVQKFTADGAFLLSWGRLVEAGGNDASGWGGFFGPRGLAVGASESTQADEIYVADTGNDRIQVFDRQGQFLRVFGGSGDGFGQLDEPAGLALDPEGYVYVADAWHRRIQVFDTNGIPVREWSVPVWAHQRPDDRPRLAVVGERVLATDPAYQRVLVYAKTGELLRALRDETGALSPGGLDVAPGGVMIADRAQGALHLYALEEFALP